MAIPALPGQELGGDILGVRRNINALRQSDYDNQIKQSEAQYAPYTNYANALSKIAYGKNAPANAIAQIMSGPGSQYLTREQAVALANQFQNLTKNAGDYSNELPAPSSMGNQSGLLGNIFNRLKSMVASGQGGTQNPMAQTAPQSQNPLQGNGMASPSQNNMGSQNQTFAPPSPTGRAGQAAQNLAIPGTQGGNNPNAGAKATEAALSTGATTEAAALGEEQKNMEVADNAQATNAVEMINQVNKLKEARNRLYWFEKGFPLGKLPAATSAAQEVDQTKENIANTIAKAEQTGHINTADRETANLMKPGRDINDKAFNHLINYSEGASHRISEKPAFDQAMANLGYTPPQIQIMWSYYNLKRPFFDTKNHKQNDDNIRSWDDFYESKKNRDIAFSPSAQKEIDKINKSKDAAPIPSGKTTQYVTLGDTKYHYVNGKYYQ